MPFSIMYAIIINMIVKLMPNLEKNSIIKAIRKFLSSELSLCLILALMCLSNLFGLEIIVLYAYTIIIILSVLFNDDMLPCVPIACCSYMTFSKANNPLGNNPNSIFKQHATKVHLYIIGITIGIVAVTRFVYEIIKNRKTLKRPKLLMGFIILLIAFVLGGLFTKYYSLRTAFFGLVLTLSLSFTYLYFYFTVDFSKVKKDYIFKLLTGIGIVLSIQIINMIIESGIFKHFEDFERGEIYTGWGINNNVGGMVALVLFAPFYLAITKKNGWIYFLIASINALLVILTLSRNSILFSFIIYVSLTGLTLIKVKKKKPYVITLSSILICLLLALLINWNTFLNFIDPLIEIKANNNGRYAIYQIGWSRFKEAMFLGNGFYDFDGVFQWGSKWGAITDTTFLPPRFHNTYVQLIASTGIVGILAYFYHRYETIKIIFNNITFEKIMLGIGIFTLILISIFDCHLFNIGPGFLYAGMLLFIEKTKSELID